MVLTGFLEFYVYCTTVLKYTQPTWLFLSLGIGTNAYAVE